jgi:hypothetical protein
MQHNNLVSQKVEMNPIAEHATKVSYLHYVHFMVDKILSYNANALFYSILNTKQLQGNQEKKIIPA